MLVGPWWGMTKFSPIPRFVPFPEPRRAHIVVTLRLAQRHNDLLVRHVRLLRDCVGLAQRRWGFEIEAAVVLPAQFDMLCAFQDANFGVRSTIALIQSAFRRHVPDNTGAVWSKDCDVLEIAPAVAHFRKTFIEQAPVRAGLVACAQDWPYSSAHHGVAQGDEMGVAVA